MYMTRKSTKPNLRRNLDLRIGAYQFAVGSNITDNFHAVCRGVEEAVRQNIRLLVFPECALTGYPPRDIKSAADVNFEELNVAYQEIKKMSEKYDMYILVGTITKEQNKYYNSARLISPGKTTENYHKRALWGWDKDNFTIGNKEGIFAIDGIKIGVRICFEVRYPEYFRELYRENTVLNIILFYDVADSDDIERYALIKSHIRTRAVENVTYTMSVNSIRPYQTAPTGIFDKSGRTINELKRNKENLLIYNFDNIADDFGEKGRR